MRALLLAAGLGTRLQPITDLVPKCMVPIGGRPLIGIWLDKLFQVGVKDVLINTHYHHEMVERYISDYYNADNVTTVYESKLLGTAGTLLKNLNFFGSEDALLIHADNYCLESLDRLILAHRLRPARCLCTMMTFRTPDPASCGIVEVDEQSVVRKFHEKVEDPPGNLANCAIYILSSEMLKILGARFAAARDFSLDVIPYFIGYIYIYETVEAFIDIGTPERYHTANRYQSALDQHK